MLFSFRGKTFLYYLYIPLIFSTLSWLSIAEGHSGRGASPEDLYVELSDRQLGPGAQLSGIRVLGERIANLDELAERKGALIAAYRLLQEQEQLGTMLRPRLAKFNFKGLENWALPLPEIASLGNNGRPAAESAARLAVSLRLNKISVFDLSALFERLSKEGKATGIVEARLAILSALATTREIEARTFQLLFGALRDSDPRIGRVAASAFHFFRGLEDRDAQRMSDRFTELCIVELNERPTAPTTRAFAHVLGILHYESYRKAFESTKVTDALLAAVLNKGADRGLRAAAYQSLFGEMKPLGEIYESQWGALLKEGGADFRQATIRFLSHYSSILNNRVPSTQRQIILSLVGGLKEDEDVEGAVSVLVRQSTRSPQVMGALIDAIDIADKIRRSDTATGNLRSKAGRLAVKLTEILNDRFASGPTMYRAFREPNPALSELGDICERLLNSDSQEVREAAIFGSAFLTPAPENLVRSLMAHSLSRTVTESEKTTIEKVLQPGGLFKDRRGVTVESPLALPSDVRPTALKPKATARPVAKPAATSVGKPFPRPGAKPAASPPQRVAIRPQPALRLHDDQASPTWVSRIARVNFHKASYFGFVFDRKKKADGAKLKPRHRQILDSILRLKITHFVLDGTTESQRASALVRAKEVLSTLDATHSIRTSVYLALLRVGYEITRAKHLAEHFDVDKLTELETRLADTFCKMLDQRPHADLDHTYVSRSFYATAYNYHISVYGMLNEYLKNAEFPRFILMALKYLPLNTVTKNEKGLNLLNKTILSLTENETYRTPPYIQAIAEAKNAIAAALEGHPAAGISESEKLSDSEESTIDSPTRSIAIEEPPPVVTVDRSDTTDSTPYSMMLEIFCDAQDTAERRRVAREWLLNTDLEIPITEAGELAELAKVLRSPAHDIFDKVLAARLLARNWEGLAQLPDESPEMLRVLSVFSPRSVAASPSGVMRTLGDVVGGNQSTEDAERAFKEMFQHECEMFLKDSSQRPRPN